LLSSLAASVSFVTISKCSIGNSTSNSKLIFARFFRPLIFVIIVLFLAMYLFLTKDMELLIVKMGLCLNRKKIEQIWQKCVQTKNGIIYFNDFKEVMMSLLVKKEQPPSKDELWIIFENFDRDGNHLLSFK